MDYNVLGNNIRFTRKSLKITQERLAELIDISPVFMSQIETGSRKPSLETVYRLSRALGKSIDLLLGGAMNEEPAANMKELSLILHNRTKSEVNFITAVVGEIMTRIDNERIVV